MPWTCFRRLLSILDFVEKIIKFIWKIFSNGFFLFLQNIIKLVKCKMYQTNQIFIYNAASGSRQEFFLWRSLCSMSANKNIKTRGTKLNKTALTPSNLVRSFTFEFNRFQLFTVLTTQHTVLTTILCFSLSITSCFSLNVRDVGLRLRFV